MEKITKDLVARTTGKVMDVYKADYDSDQLDVRSGMDVLTDLRDMQTYFSKWTAFLESQRSDGAKIGRGPARPLLRVLLPFLALAPIPISRGLPCPRASRLSRLLRPRGTCQRPRT